ncbi:MAG: uracil DNA glycosylase [Geoglossum simile]|nr:MAG: uracil DNA glycosylase [Geoglossum simile]
MVLPTSHLLLQVAASVKAKAPTTTTAILPQTTWISALQVAIRSLESTDQQLVIFPKTTRERQQALKEISFASLPPATDISPSFQNGLPIKTSFPKHQPPPRSSAALSERLRELAKENMAFGDREPYPLQIRAGSIERVLPVVTGTLSLRGLDKDPDDETDSCCLDINEMLWDTGAHCCIITEDILPSEFRTYLQSPEHDPYRHENGLFVQVDGYIALTNTAFVFGTVFHVRPARSLPNGRSGVILGHNGFLNRIVWTSIPRIILKRRGEDIGSDMWGEIHISEYIDIMDDHCTF